MPKTEAKPVTLTIDDIEVTVPEGTTVLDAAKAAGIYIPYLCAHPVLRPWGACRMCTVEIEKARGIPTSCTSPVAPGMVVRTNTPAVQGLRRNVMELILTEHPIGCLSCHKRDQCGPQETCLRSYAVDFRCVTCPANYRCELQLNCDYVGLDEIAMPVRSKNIPLRRDPIIALDWNLCIVCGRCVRVCDEVRDIGVYGIVDRSGGTMIDTAYGAPLEDSGCIFCGACVDVCPVGAIEERRNRFAGVADSVTESICAYCSDGCGFRLEQKRGQLIRIQPIWDAPANGGMYCVKGRFATAEPNQHPSRLKTPLIRRDGDLVEASWEEALSLVAREFAARRGTIGVIGSVRTSNEATYLLQKLARTALGTPHIDTSARLADTAGLLGLRNVLGLGASTTDNHALDDAELILVAGLNPQHTSPITAMKIRQATRRQVRVQPNTGYFSYLPDTGVRERPRAGLIVIDPRRIDLVDHADLWLRPRPGTDRMLLASILREVLATNRDVVPFLDRLDNLEELRASLEEFDPVSVERLTGVPAGDIADAAIRISNAGSLISLFGRGLTQQPAGVAAVEVLAALHAVTGNLEKDGAGIIHAVGANNSRGAFDLGALPEFGPGYQPGEPGGLRLVEQLRAAAAGDLTALYIVGSNPLVSAPGPVEAALNRAFTVVQDLYLTETAKHADVVLPAASTAEHDGTFTGADRRIQRFRKAIEPIGTSRPDWAIIAEIGRRLDAEEYGFVHPLEVFDEIAAVSPIHAGMTYDLLDDGPSRWPLEGSALADRFSLPVVAPADEAESRTLTLQIGSGFFHFGTATQTTLVKQFGHFEQPGTVEIHHDSLPDLVDGQRVRIASDFGSTDLTLRRSPTAAPGIATVTLGHAAIHLFDDAIDNASGTPLLKAGSVRIDAI